MRGDGGQVLGEGEQMEMGQLVGCEETIVGDDSPPSWREKQLDRAEFGQGNAVGKGTAGESADHALI